MPASPGPGPDAEMMMTKAVFYHAGCGVCTDAESALVAALDPARVRVEVVNVLEDRGRIAEAERAGVKSLPALVLAGRPYHINHGADLSAL